MNAKLREGFTLPDTAEAKARRLAQLTREIKEGAADMDRRSAERLELMVSLHRDDGWNNVQIGEAADLTRARVSTILKPELERRTTVNGG